MNLLYFNVGFETIQNEFKIFVGYRSINKMIDDVLKKNTKLA